MYCTNTRGSTYTATRKRRVGALARLHAQEKHFPYPQPSCCQAQFGGEACSTYRRVRRTTVSFLLKGCVCVGAGTPRGIENGAEKMELQTFPSPLYRFTPFTFRAPTQGFFPFSCLFMFAGHATATNGRRREMDSPRHPKEPKSPSQTFS